MTRFASTPRVSLEIVSLYSIMEDPMTSCGCFECICGIEPFSNGVVIVNREHPGMTPLGMSFSEMASMTGGGVQTPGFMGHGKHFIASKKFMKAEGGVARIVWMPKALKEQVAEKLNATAQELYGIENFTDMIADETDYRRSREAAGVPRREGTSCTWFRSSYVMMLGSKGFLTPLIPG